MRIHAYRRKEATPVDTGNTVIEFKPNGAGEVIADVEGSADVEILLSIPEAFREYLGDGATAAVVVKPLNAVPTAAELAALSFSGVAAGGDGAAPNPFLLQDGEEKLDLSAMDDEALKLFAKANGLNPHYRWAGDVLRQKIVDHLLSKAGE